MNNKESIRQAWLKACEFDEIPPGSSFVVFSKENPYAREYDLRRQWYAEGRSFQSFDCWMSDTCFVCSNGTGIPRYHASSDGYRATSPCDTTVTMIEAPSRAEALRIYKSRHKRR